jgi:hypothetical protein
MDVIPPPIGPAFPLIYIYDSVEFHKNPIIFRVVYVEKGATFDVIVTPLYLLTMISFSNDIYAFGDNIIFMYTLVTFPKDVTKNNEPELTVIFVGNAVYIPIMNELENTIELEAAE